MREKQDVLDDFTKKVDQLAADAKAELAAFDKPAWPKAFKDGERCFALRNYGGIVEVRYECSLADQVPTNSLFHSKAEAERELLERRSRVKTCAWPGDDWGSGFFVGWDGNIYPAEAYTREWVYLLYTCGRYHLPGGDARKWKAEFHDKLAEEPGGCK